VHTLEIKRIDFRVNGKGDNALAESMLAMNQWLKERPVRPINVETMVDTSSSTGFAGLGGTVSSGATGVRLWYVDID
jgi:hypothetical protein